MVSLPAFSSFNLKLYLSHSLFNDTLKEALLNLEFRLTR